MQCLLPNQKIIYDSSFTDDDSTKSYLSVLSVGTDHSAYSISVNTFSNVLECTIVTYNRVLLNVKNILIERTIMNSQSCYHLHFHKLHHQLYFLIRSLKKGKFKYFPQDH